MKTCRHWKERTALTVCGMLLAAAVARGDDPLPSWNEGPVKRALLAFVERVTREGSADFVPPSQRIAVFDNDGTLWSEKPFYFQGFFIADRIKALAPQHPEWQREEPYATVLRGDLQGLASSGEKELLQLVMATHAGMTADEFETVVATWIATARHPTSGRLLTEMVFQPMLELLNFLRANGFQTYIVSGGGIDFIRPWSERVYGIPQPQVVGSSIKTRFEVRDGQPVIIRLPEIDFVDDGPGKPVGIQQHIGERPILAVGNSDGDFEMLQWTTAGQGPRLGLLVHHDDAAREFAYDRDSHVGRLARGLDEGPGLGWSILSMRNDWNTIYPQLAANDAAAPAALAGEWLAEDLGGKGVVDSSHSTLVFAADGNVSGDTAVNRFSGTATISGNQLKFGPLAVTRRAGPPALMDQEARFTQALTATTAFRIDPHGKLILLDAQGTGLARFSR